MKEETTYSFSSEWNGDVIRNKTAKLSLTMCFSELQPAGKPPSSQQADKHGVTKKVWRLQQFLFYIRAWLINQLANIIDWFKIVNIHGPAEDEP